MVETKIRVLLIEDSPGDSRLIYEMLVDGQDSQFTLECVSSLSEGLAKLENGQFDIILSDLGLPDSQGLGTFTAIEKEASRIPIIVLSGLDDEDLAVDAVHRGAQDYIVKGSSDSRSLRRSLRYAIERKRISEALRIKDRVIESSINPIMIADLQGKVTYVNGFFLKLWEYESVDEVLGRAVDEFWHRSTEALWVIENVVKHGSWKGKIHGRKKGDAELDLQLSAFIVKEKDDEGEPLCMVFSFMDVTELTRLKRRLKSEESFAGIIGYDVKMLELFDTIRQVAEVDVPVLIQGESGTGKELVANAIHTQGSLADKPFVAVNCGALPEGVLESELFGHVKGAFTGAVRDRKGRFELADGGTIFLDEIGELPPQMQVKLLRVLQEGTFQRVGGEETIKVKVRIVSATNKNLADEVNEGRFRDDLFYRLCVVPVYLPPLRERISDIPLLAEHLLKKSLAEMGKENISMSPEAIDAMMAYCWPGNVRELENAIQCALVKCKGDLLMSEYLPIEKGRTFAGENSQAKKERKRKLDEETVCRVLEETGGNKLQAVRKLGVSRATLYRFLRENEKTLKIS